MYISVLDKIITYYTCLFNHYNLIISMVLYGMKSSIDDMKSSMDDMKPTIVNMSSPNYGPDNITK